MKIKDSGERRQFDTGAVRDVAGGKGRFDLLSPVTLTELAKYMEEGANKYPERNWEQGIPMHCYMDSAFRHYCKYMAGETDENHLVALLWNVHCAVHTEIMLPHLQDIPARAGNHTEPIVSKQRAVLTVIEYANTAICSSCYGLIKRYGTYFDLSRLDTCPICGTPVGAVNNGVGEIAHEEVRRLLDERNTWITALGDNYNLRTIDMGCGGFAPELYPLSTEQK